MQGIGLEGRAAPAPIEDWQVITFYCPDPRCRAVLGAQMMRIDELSTAAKRIIAPGITRIPRSRH